MCGGISPGLLMLSVKKWPFNLKHFQVNISQAGLYDMKLLLVTPKSYVTEQQ